MIMKVLWLSFGDLKKPSGKEEQCMHENKMVEERTTRLIDLSRNYVTTFSSFFRISLVQNGVKV